MQQEHWSSSRGSAEQREKTVFELEEERRQPQQQRGSISSREGAVEGGETTREIARVWQKQDFF